MNSEHLLWFEKYRPHKIKDTILSTDLKQTFQAFVQKKEVPNLLLHGPKGIGKTTVARALLDEAGCDHMFINASMDRNIDTLRNEILQYASTMSFSGNRKYVILDEADYLNPNSFQPALRSFMETYAKNCGFILTANFLHKIIEPLHSRCAVVSFKIKPKDEIKLATRFLKRCCEILDGEKVTYDESVVAQLIQKMFPDWRGIINELQRYSATGKIDSGILTDFEEVALGELLKALQEQNFSKTRAWVAQHAVEVDEFYPKLFESLPDILSKAGFANAVLTLAKYQYESAFVTNHEINKTACLLELMVSLKGEWKNA